MMRTEYDDVIRAWLDGAEVEQMQVGWVDLGWLPFDGCWQLDPAHEWQYRIAKPAQEPKYLWVYLNGFEVSLKQSQERFSDPKGFLGKIRLEE